MWNLFSYPTDTSRLHDEDAVVPGRFEFSFRLDYEDRSVGECAAITELSEGNVKVRLHRIRKKLYVLVNDEMNGTE